MTRTNEPKGPSSQTPTEYLSQKARMPSVPHSQSIYLTQMLSQLTDPILSRGIAIDCQPTIRLNPYYQWVNDTDFDEPWHWEDPPDQTERELESAQRIVDDALAYARAHRAEFNDFRQKRQIERARRRSGDTGLMMDDEEEGCE